ncbi:MAG: VOC family protein [Chloroflexi bacterium]|nr:VOC family protein [Chloroflexota bacterium]
MLKRLDNIGIAVRDVRRAHDFYTRVLGFEGAPLADGATGFSAKLGDVALFVFATDKTNAPGRTADYEHNPVGIDHLAFEVEDYEGAQRELESRGVRFLQESVGEPGGFRYRGFTDPDGNMLYVIHTGG